MWHITWLPKVGVLELVSSAQALVVFGASKTRIWCVQNSYLVRRKLVSGAYKPVSGVCNWGSVLIGTYIMGNDKYIR